MRFGPRTSKVSPACPLVDESVGTTRNGLVLWPEPPGVVTVSLPFVAPAGTVAVRWLESGTLVGAVLFVPKATEVAPVKSCPVSETEVPTVPLVGLRLATIGGGPVSAFWRSTRP